MLGLLIWDHRRVILELLLVDHDLRAILFNWNGRLWVILVIKLCQTASLSGWHLHLNWRSLNASERIVDRLSWCDGIFSNFILHHLRYHRPQPLHDIFTHGLL